MLFNIGNYRRKIVGTSNCRADFFDPNNKEAAKERQQCAQLAMKDMIQYLNEKEGNVAIYDGTNTTKARRRYISETLKKEIEKFNLIFLESICSDEDVIENNIRQAKLNNPDYEGVDPEEAIKDF